MILDLEPQNNLLLRHGVLGQLLSTTKDGEHEDVVVTNAVHDSITSQEHLSDVVTLDLRNDTRRQGHSAARSAVFRRLAIHLRAACGLSRAM